MRRRSHFLYLRNSASPPPAPAPAIIKRLAVSTSVRRYSGSHEKEDSHGMIDQERAPSTADEFRRVAEEKAAAGQTAAEDSAQESTADDGDFGSVKEDYKQTQGKAAGEFSTAAPNPNRP
ncbi:uncharacterized protein LOC127247228 [Andrographis paniculata]|uniref:uncharacterized protein LOC127247228 n=1 Tax=Andrographis paniculata TaxID=175694 RepID=UPI0021E7233D|nr:uncharacterized protein LOC127247228 [Andrographis paniculata]